MTIRRKLALLAAGVIAGVTWQASSIASDLGPTLDKIKASGVIAVGHRTSSVPFSYYDENEKVIGYSQDLCNHIIDAVKEKLGMPNLTVRMIPITSQNRMSLVQNGTVDLACGVASNLKDRWNQVAYLISFFGSTPAILTRKDSGIKEFGDLAGKAVVTNAGSSPERLLREMNEKNHMNIRIQSVKEYADGLLILQSGRAQAYYMDDILMAGTRLQAQNPDDYALVGKPISGLEPWGFMVRKDDPVFKALGDAALGKLFQSPEIRKLYTRWFESPIPPNNANFNFPMSTAVADLYAHPNDRPAE